MGLKYSVFVAPTDSRVLRDKFVSIGFVDETEKYVRAKEFYEEQNKWLQNKLDSEGDVERWKDEYLQILDDGPEDPEVKEMFDRVYGVIDELPGLSFWWLQYDSEWVIGMYTSIRWFNYTFEAIAHHFLQRAGLKEFYFQSYSSVVEEALVIGVLGSNHKMYPPPKEPHQYRGYLSDVGEMIGAPLQEIHDYLDSDTGIEWDYVVTYLLKNPIRRREPNESEHN